VILWLLVNLGVYCSLEKLDVFRFRLCCDWQSVSQSVLVSGPHLKQMTWFLLLSDICDLHGEGRPPWREDGPVIYSCNLLSLSSPSPAELMTTSEVEVKLRPTISWPACLGVGLPSGAHDLIFFCLTIAGFLLWVPSLTRGWVCNLLVQLLLGLARAITLGSSPTELRPLSHLRLPQPGSIFKVKVMLRLMVSQYVLVSSPLWNLWPDIIFCLKVAVLSLWGTLSDKMEASWSWSWS
jgi:hypothetical protein